MNPFEMLKNAQSIKEQLAKVQEELEDLTATGSSGGSIVKVTMNGKKVLQSIKIDPNAVDTDDIEMLEDLIIVAVNDAYAKADELYKKKMGPLGGAGGLF